MKNLEIVKRLAEIDHSCQKRGAHLEGDVLTHTQMVAEQIERIQPYNSILKAAAWLHDVGKYTTRSINNDKVQFLDHHIKGEKIAREELIKQGFGPKTIDHICYLIKNHLAPMFLLQNPTKKAWKRFVNKHGEYTRELLYLSYADIMGRIPQGIDKANKLMELVNLICPKTSCKKALWPKEDSERAGVETKIYTCTECGMSIETLR